MSGPRPTPDRLVGDDNPTLQRHLFDQAQAKRKSEIQPHRMSDHGRRETVALVADGGMAHHRRIARGVTTGLQAGSGLLPCRKGRLLRLRNEPHELLKDRSNFPSLRRLKDLPIDFRISQSKLR